MCGGGPFEDIFSFVPADVTVDGTFVGEIGLRKKGFLGSLDDEKPSLKLKFDRYIEGQSLSGMKRMTLNNAMIDNNCATLPFRFGFIGGLSRFELVKTPSS